MVKLDPAERRGRPDLRLKRIGGWLFTILLLLLTALFLLLAIATLVGDASYLGYLATRGTEFDTWGVLTIVSTLLSLAALLGAGLALLRRRFVLALGASLLALPMGFVIEGSRCDTEVSCRTMGWASLPPGAFDWSVRIRPVTERNEAERIASRALYLANADGSPFMAKRFADHWIVSTINGDGRPGARAVRIDTKSAEAALVACPADRIRCGMEWPIVSDGRRVFRNDPLGLSAVFPVSRPVCTMRGEDDEPRGFFAVVRPPDEPCDLVDDSRQMGVGIPGYTLSGCAVVEAPSTPWRPLSPETARLFKRAPTLGGHPSMVCELRTGGHIQISIYSLAQPPSGGHGTRYEAYIVTTPAHLAEDVRALESFLESVHLESSS